MKTAFVFWVLDTNIRMPQLLSLHLGLSPEFGEAGAGPGLWG